MTISSCCCNKVLNVVHHFVFRARMSLTSTNLVNQSTISEKPVYPFGDGGNPVTSSQWMEWHGCSALCNFSPGIGFAFILFNRQDAQELSVPHSQYQNGFVERHVQTLRNMTATVLHSSGLPKSYWAEALLWARYAWNCIPRWDNENLSPYEAITGRNVGVSQLHPFGC